MFEDVAQLYRHGYIYKAKDVRLQKLSGLALERVKLNKQVWTIENDIYPTHLLLCKFQ